MLASFSPGELPDVVLAVFHYHILENFLIVKEPGKFKS